MRLLAVVLALLLATTACSSDGNGSGPTEASTPEPTTVVASGCPIPDEAFCVTATDAANALAARDAGQLLQLSRSSTIDCAEVAREYFPGCRAQEVLDGFGLSGADLLVEVLARDAYLDRLAAITSGIDPSFSDALGDGAVRVLGVGTCGPDVPGRRTYHLAWTAAVSEDGAAAERVLGSFELTLEDDWRIALLYVGALERWEAEQTDPRNEAFCAAGRSPWRP